MVRLYRRWTGITGIRANTLSQQRLPPTRSQFPNRPPLVDLLANIPQQLHVFVVKFAIPIASALRLEQVVALFPHAQELGTHSKQARNSFDTIACHTLTPRAGS